jgi:hypothetical protein
MKRIHIIQFALLAFIASSMLAACSDDQPFSTAEVNDNPRILDPVFPDRNSDGSLPVIVNINRDGTLNMNLTVTPADYTTVTWYLDSAQIHTGKDIDTTLLAGTYYMKIVATTDAGKSTFREGIVQVNPLAGDPSTITKAFERYVAPGQTARLYGNNLDKVKAIVVGTEEASGLNYVASTDGNYLEYTVPKSLQDGDYRIILKDAAGKEYGGDLLHVIYSPLVTSGANRATSDSPWTISGINMDNIASLSINGKTVTTFTSQSATELTFTCPSLSDGDYTLTGKTKSGTDVQFYTSGGIATQILATISTEKTLWSGHHYVSWELPDGNPNKMFNLISTDVFASIKAGSVMKIHYSLNAADAYHQMQVTTGWWTMLPGTAKTDLTGDGVFELTLTQADLDLIQQQAGFLCVGHGYYVDAVTLK